MKTLTKLLSLAALAGAMATAAPAHADTLRVAYSNGPVRVAHGPAAVPDRGGRYVARGHVAYRPVYAHPYGRPMHYSHWNWRERRWDRWHGGRRW